jgi:parallel beta-helix repeat protein
VTLQQFVQQFLWKYFGRAAAERPGGAARLRRLGVEALEQRWVPATVRVGPDDSIQAAINASNAGDTIRVSGVHAEQLSVNKTVNLVGLAGAEIDAPASLTGGAIVDITATNVIVQGFTISGKGNAGGLIDSGLAVENGASATITNDTITGLYNATVNQAGFGVRVAAGGTAKITNDSISGYQKGGVIVDGSGAVAIIRNNTITGVGVSTNVAQNGVQVSNGASAMVSFNTITGNSFNGSFNGTGVYVLNDSAKVIVGQNTIGSQSNPNDVGVLVQQSSNTALIDNRVRGNFVNGIYLDTSENISLIGNEVNHNLGNGIVLFNSTGNTLLGNESNHNAGNGIIVNGGSGNTIALSATSNNGADGLQLFDTSHNVLALNLSTGNVMNGIDLIGATRNVIEDNIAAGNKGGAITFDAASTGNTVHWNITGSDRGFLCFPFLGFDD